jgi:hypothetical protein
MQFIQFLFIFMNDVCVAFWFIVSMVGTERAIQAHSLMRRRNRRR